LCYTTKPVQYNTFRAALENTSGYAASK